MRLINTSTGLLEEFMGKIPEYAILSHTWGGEEISLDEYKRLTRPDQDTTPLLMAAKEKTGFVKISKFIELAASEGICYAWADTCCIDKASSAELGEAINSMYQWYQQANICYVYLSDVETGSVRSGPDAMECSRWFTRRWTLQELIAPKILHFYTSTWDLIGSKEDLARSLTTWTSIPSHVISSGNPHTCCTGAKMSWASKRKTTRPEDMAYCLMGLFDVNMPLLYGEGEKAFTRLQEHIAAATTDHSLFVWNMKVPEELDNYTNSLAFHRGLFARSPVEFDIWRRYRDLYTKGYDVEIGESIFSPAEAFSQTNRGLHVILPTVEPDIAERYTEQPASSYVAFTENEYVAVLNCSLSLSEVRKDVQRDWTEWYFCLVLTKIDPRMDSNDGFARIGHCVLLRYHASPDRPTWSPTQEERHNLKRRMWISQRLVADPQSVSPRMSGFKIVEGASARLTLHSFYQLNAQENTVHWPLGRPERQGGFVGLAVIDPLYLPGTWAVVFGFPRYSDNPVVGITDKFDLSLPLTFSFSGHDFRKDALGSRIARVKIGVIELVATLNAVIVEDKLIGRIEMSVYYGKR